MARRPREDVPGSWHHVINRGVGKRPLFEDREDARFFLAQLARQVRAGRLEIHVFCLMSTHFHLLVRSPKGQLSEAMRQAQNEHSRQFNRRRERVGTLIQGRYTSKPVRSLLYRQALVGYIDANPVKAGIVGSSHEYDLGSARLYAQPTGPKWLCRQWVEAEACSLSRTAHFSLSAYEEAFRSGGTQEASELVLARLASTATKDPLDELVGFSLDRLREWLCRQALTDDGYQPGLPVCSQQTLEKTIADNLDLEGPWLVRDGRVNREGMDLAQVGLLRTLCGLSWRAIAAVSVASAKQVQRRWAQHNRVLESCDGYTRRVSRIAKAAIDRCVG